MIVKTFRMISSLVYREVPDGGTVTLLDGSTSYANCAGDIVFDVTHTTTAPNLSYWYIITDDNDNISCLSKFC